MSVNKNYGSVHNHEVTSSVKILNVALVTMNIT